MSSWFLRPLLPLVLCGLLAPHIPGARADSHVRGQRHDRSAAARARSAERRRRDALAHRLHDLHSRMHGVRSRIHSGRVKETHIAETIGAVEHRIQLTRQDLNHVNSQLVALDSQHEVVARRLDSTRARLAHEKRVLSQRLRDNYQHRKATYVQTLLQSSSVHEMLSRAYLVRIIVRSDAELIGGIQADVAQVAADKQVVEAQALRQKRLASELEAAKGRFVADVTKKRILLHGVRAERAEAEQELDDLEAEATAMTGRIRALTEILRRQQEAATRAARRRGGRGRGTRMPIAPARWRGGFARPCGGPLTSGFGMRFHPILHRYRMHTGVDFGAGYGAPIRAAGDGVVLFSAYNRGYGNCIILYHGNGVSTLYGHCSARLVREGQFVRVGQQIARVGATGLATGPHLHFEVRRNGVPIAPY